MSSPRLVDTATAVAFLIRMRGGRSDEQGRRSARDHLYYLAKAGKINNHGGSTRGQALWDLREIARTCT